MADAAGGRETGAGRETRTPDLRFTKPLLYQLSYTGRAAIIATLVARGAPRFRVGAGCRGALYPDVHQAVTVANEAFENFLDPGADLTRELSRRLADGIIVFDVEINTDDGAAQMALRKLESMLDRMMDDGYERVSIRAAEH